MTEPETDAPGAAPPPEADARRRRLLFRASHRGTKEADLLLGGFVAREIGRLGEAELHGLEALMELPDVDLADWLCGRRPVPEALRSPLMLRLVEACSATGAGLPAPLRRDGRAEG